jgi:hypothetical protein
VGVKPTYFSLGRIIWQMFNEVSKSGVFISVKLRATFFVNRHLKRFNQVKSKNQSEAIFD